MPTSAVTLTSTVVSDTAAYERLAYFQLRQEFYFPQCADVRPTAQTHPGTSVNFNVLDELSVEATPTALTEGSDVTPTALSDSHVNVTLNEYGHATTVSNLLRGTSYLNEMMRASEEIGYHGGKTFDNLARNPLLGGSNVIFAGSATSRATIAGTDTLSADDVRNARVILANNSAKRFEDDYYHAYIVPDVLLDLQIETGSAAWREPRVQSGARVEDIWRGLAGVFEGFAFVETPRLDIPELPTGWLNGGATNEDVYPTLFMGRQALALVHAEPVSGPEPSIRIAPVTDILSRFRGVGWLWVGGFGRFREASLVRVESASSIGT